MARHTDFWALRNFTFHVATGECVGIIGANGAGKSTLLKILSQTLSPSAGSFRINGKVLSLLELGAGFSQDLTGRQNVIEAASLLGFSDSDVRRRMDDIAAFAQIGEFFDRPLRMYSSGMAVRLAFSMYAFFDPDVLIIDEALAVGDAAFQRKCFRRIQELVENQRRAAVLVSHDLQSMIKFCSRIYWLHHGEIKMTGDPAPVVQEYLRFMFGGAAHDDAAARHGPATQAEVAADAPGPRIPDQSAWMPRSPAAILYVAHDVQLVAVWLEDQNRQHGCLIPVNQPFSVCYALKFDANVASPVFGIQIATPRGECVIQTNTEMMQAQPRAVQAGQTVIVRWPIAPGLAVGDYFISCGCSLADDLYHFLMREVDAYQFSVVGPVRQSGLCALNAMPEIEMLP